MRVARGRVVGNTVVLEGDPLPEGTVVTVISGGDELWELDEASMQELIEAVAAADRGELVDYDEVAAQLPPA